MRAAIYGTSVKDRALFGGDRDRPTADDYPRVNQPDGSGAKADYQADRRN